jgi:hypothetical protein
MGEFTNQKKHKHVRSVSRDFKKENKENNSFIILRESE